MKWWWKQDNRVEAAPFTAEETATAALIDSRLATTKITASSKAKRALCELGGGHNAGSWWETYERGRERVVLTKCKDCGYFLIQGGEQSKNLIVTAENPKPALREWGHRVI